VTTDGRGHAPATERNREPILDVLRGVLPERGWVLELASGTGEHCCYFAKHFPELTFQPSDPDASSRESIAAWSEHEGRTNVRPPLDIRADAHDWGIDPADPPDGILNINMVHISPWSACEGLMRGAGRLLAQGAPLYLYGPYKREGRHTARSNDAFDQSLRGRSSRWGVRDLEDVVECAERNSLRLDCVVPMPANNFSVVLRREA
jgi:hypothetical protein